MLRFDKDGTLYFACTNCFTLIRLHGIKNYIKNLTFRNKDKNGNKLKIHIDAKPFLETCPYCGMPYYERDEDAGELFEVDPDIALDILELNQKGYQTYYSYSSHCEKNGFVSESDADFYVMIDLPKKIIDDNIVPDGFKIENVAIHDLSNYPPDWSRYIIRYDISVYQKKHLSKLWPMWQSDGEVEHLIPYDVWEEEYKIALKNFKDWVKELPDLIMSEEMILELDYDVEEWV